jgi:hypothetical protein
MSKMQGTAFPTFQLKVCCEAYLAHAPFNNIELPVNPVFCQMNRPLMTTYGKKLAWTRYG